MYKQFYSKLLLLVAMIVAGAGTSWAATYKLTKVTSVEAGGLYVFEQDGHVMNNTVSSSALQTTDSYSKTNLTGTETYVWTLETGDTNGCFYMKNVSVNDGYLYNGSSTGVSLSQNHSNWKFNFQDDETVLIQNSNNSYRFLGYSSNTSYAYKAYAMSNIDSYPHAIVVYKLEEENGDTPSLTASDLSLTGTTNALSFDLFNNSDAQVLNYSTSSTGAVTVSENAYVTTIVDEANKTITVTPVAITPSEQTLTISQAADNNYAAGSVRFTVNITNNDPNAPGTANNPYTVTQARAAIDANAGVTEVYAKGIVSKIVTAFNSQYGNISYNISEDGTEEADQLEAYRGFSYNGEWFTSADDIQVGDEVVIYGNLKKYNSTYEFDANNQLVSLVRPQASQDPVIKAEDVNLAYDATSGEIEFSIENLVESYNVTALADVDWISNVTVAADANKVTFTTSVNEGTEAREGNITINYGGTTVVTRKVVKVTQGFNNNTEPVSGNGSYVKVTSTDGITSGQYLIVYEGDASHDAAAFNGGLETLDAANNTIEITINNDEIAATTATKAAEFTIDVTAGTIKSASGFYIGKTAYSNGLDAKADTQYTNTFAITNDEAVITASGNCTLRYNYASDQLRFRYYKTGQQAIQLYKLVENFVPTVTIGAAEWATYVAVDNVEFPEEVTAYVPVQVNEGQTAVMIESVNAVKKGEPVILNGEAGTYDLSIAETEPAEVENIFEVSDGTDVSDGTFYMLSYKNEKVGFRKVQEEVTIPAGKPYIVIVNAAKEFIPFGGGEATGIESFETVGFDVNAPIYDMQGRQVQKLQKGIFIQNGKKLIVK